MRLLRHRNMKERSCCSPPFAVVLLASISSTMASNASPLPLIDGLQRDLGAIRAQLERTDPASSRDRPAERRLQRRSGLTEAAFRHRSITTILRSANRRLENLVTGYRNGRDVRRAEVAETAQLELQELFGRVHHLGNATDETSTMWARKRLEAAALIDRLQDRLFTLLERPAATRARNLG